jgi:Uma2 family endonuclease
MATVIERVRPEVELIESDGIPLENPWHFAAIALMKDLISYRFRGRTDYFMGGNMFLYFSEEQARNRDYRGPDFFFVDKVDGKRWRDWWAIWDEDYRFPDVIMELLSKTTEKLDLTVKKDLYEKTFQTHEYFCFGPTGKLLGWRLGPKGRYQAVRPGKRGWLWCEKLELYVGSWEGKYQDSVGIFPRFYDSQGHLLPTAEEAANQRLASAAQTAEAEKQRADQAEAQLAQLRAQLAQLESASSQPRKADA